MVDAFWSVPLNNDSYLRKEMCGRHMSYSQLLRVFQTPHLYLILRLDAESVHQKDVATFSGQNWSQL